MSGNYSIISNALFQIYLEAIYPKRNLSRAEEPEMRFPYLMDGMNIERSNKVWCEDITYIPLEEGFGYCVAVMDWWSRCVLA